jgi:hypothetical protein
MLLKTILNHRYPLKGFVYGKCQIVGNESSGKDEIHVQLTPRKNSRPVAGLAASRVRPTTREQNAASSSYRSWAFKFSFSTRCVGLTASTAV